MSAITKGVFIVAAKRTAFGTYGGTLKSTPPIQLQTTAAKAAISAAGLRPEQIDTVNVGHVLTISTSDGAWLPRHLVFHCGIPIERPALGVNRLCGSGFQAIVNGAQDILVGAAKVSLTGGADSMSLAPHAARGLRFGVPLGVAPALEDSLMLGLYDSFSKLPMPNTAENLAEQYKIPREKADEFALRSQQLWKKAQDEGVFKTEIEPFKIKVKGKEVDFAVDEHPRPQSTLEGLAKLPSLFKKNGTVTAGSASGICDGAAAVIVASEEACKEYNLKPLARLVAYATVGCPPEIMGIGPVPAITNVLKTAGWQQNDVDLYEINEAFAVQVLACVQALGLDINKLNLNGGAVALGHPLGASGSRITGHLVHELRRKNLKRAIGSACIGGGQGIALAIETV